MSTESIKSMKKRGYMYIGHVPHGFYEKQMKAYFSQFGKVRRIRLSRSKKTGNYRGYGFIEFESESVAKIAAETMNNYLMFNRVLKCQQIEKEKLHPKAFKNSQRFFVKPVKSWFRRTYNRKKSIEQIEKSKKKTNRKLNEKQKKLNALGIDINVKDLVQGGGDESKKRKSALVKEEKKVTAPVNKKKKVEEPVVASPAVVDKKKKVEQPAAVVAPLVVDKKKKKQAGKKIETPAPAPVHVPNKQQQKKTKAVEEKKQQPAKTKKNKK